MTIAKRICELRGKLAMNQAEFGELFGVSAMAISRWERKGAVPSQALVTMALEAHKIGLSPWSFLEVVGLTRSDVQKVFRK